MADKSPVGPIRPLDMLYGHTRSIEEGQHYMAHRTGFTPERLGNLLLSAGFATVSVRSQDFEVCALAMMPEADGVAMRPELDACGFHSGAICLTYDRKRPCRCVKVYCRRDGVLPHGSGLSA